MFKAHRRKDKTARRSYFLTAFLLIYLLSAVLSGGIQHIPWYKTLILEHHSSKTQQVLIFAFMRFCTILVSFLFHFYAYKKEWDIKLAKYVFDKLNQSRLKIAMIQQEERQEQQRISRELKVVEGEKAKRIKLKRIGDIQTYQFEAYEILSATAANQPFVFLLEFFSEFDTEAPPIVKIDNLPVSLTPVSSSPNECICQIEKLVVSTHIDGYLTFCSGKYEFKVINPYKMKITDDKIIWQCEGRPDEKNIFIPISYFVNFDPNVVYPFDILINNKVMCSLVGAYQKEFDRVVVPIGGSLSKSDFFGSGKSVTLRYSVGETQKIVLPTPCVISQNGKQVKRIESIV